MASLDPRLYQDREREIAERLEKLAAEVVAGKATDLPDYKHRVGRIRGLQDALEIAREANARVIGIDRK